jgi:hypothetical protein
MQQVDRQLLELLEELPIPPLEPEAEEPLEMPLDGRLLEEEPLTALEPAELLTLELGGGGELTEPDELRGAAAAPAALPCAAGAAGLLAASAAEPLLLNTPERADVVGAGVLLAGGFALVPAAAVGVLAAGAAGLTGRVVCAGGGACLPAADPAAPIAAAAAPTAAPARAPVSMPEATDELRP